MTDAADQSNASTGHAEAADNAVCSDSIGLACFDPDSIGLACFDPDSNDYSTSSSDCRFDSSSACSDGDSIELASLNTDSSGYCTSSSGCSFDSSGSHNARCTAEAAECSHHQADSSPSSGSLTHHAFLPNSSVSQADSMLHSQHAQLLTVNEPMSVLTDQEPGQQLDADKDLYTQGHQSTSAADAASADIMTTSDRHGSEQHDTADDGASSTKDAFEEESSSSQPIVYPQSDKDSSHTSADADEQHAATASPSTDSNNPADLDLWPVGAAHAINVKQHDHDSLGLDKMHTTRPDLDSDAAPHSSQQAPIGNADWQIPAAWRSGSFSCTSSNRGTGTSRGMGSMRVSRNLRGIGSIRGCGSMFNAVAHGNDYLSHHDKNCGCMAETESVNNGTAVAACNSSAASTPVLEDSANNSLLGSQNIHTKAITADVSHSRYPAVLPPSVNRPAGNSLYRIAPPQMPSRAKAVKPSKRPAAASASVFCRPGEGLLRQAAAVPADNISRLPQILQNEQAWRNVPVATMCALKQEFLSLLETCDASEQSSARCAKFAHCPPTSLQMLVYR